MYSFRISFWTVPPIRSYGTPCFSQTAIYIAHKTEAGELMVMEDVTSPSGMPSNSVSMSASESMATPHLPTSPAEEGWSESYPIKVGRSKAVDSPIWPCSSRYLNRRLVSTAVPYPANIRMVQSLPRYIVG